MSNYRDIEEWEKKIENGVGDKKEEIKEKHGIEDEKERRDRIELEGLKSELERESRIREIMKKRLAEIEAIPMPHTPVMSAEDLEELDRLLVPPEKEYPILIPEIPKPPAEEQVFVQPEMPAIEVLPEEPLMIPKCGGGMNIITHTASEAITPKPPSKLHQLIRRISGRFF